MSRTWQFIGIAYAFALITLYLVASYEWISYESVSTYTKKWGVTLTPVTFPTKECKRTPPSTDTYLAISLVQRDGKAFLATYELVGLNIKTADHEYIYVNKTKLLRLGRSDEAQWGLAGDGEPSRWGFPVKLSRGATSWLYSAEDEEGGLLSGSNARFSRPYDTYYAGFSIAAKSSSSTSAPRFKKLFASLSWFQLGKVKDVPIGSIKIFPPVGFVVVPVKSLGELGPFVFDNQEHDFLSDSCDVYFFQLKREPIEVWFGSFLLALAILPIILLLSDNLVIGIEFLGSIGAVGLLRVAVVGADRSPYRIDLILGLVLLVIALVLTRRAVTSKVQRIREQKRTTDVPNLQNRKRWLGSRLH